MYCLFLTYTTFFRSSPSTHKSRTFPSKRPALPSRPDNLPRPTISTPVNVTSTRDEVDTIHVQKEVVKPSRPPPPPSKGSPNITGDKKEAARREKPTRPPRPKSKLEVITWWKEIEYAKLSGLDENKKPMEWFHGKNSCLKWISVSRFKIILRLIIDTVLYFKYCPPKC